MNYLKIIDELAGHHSAETDSPTSTVEPSSDNDGALLTVGHPAYSIVTTCQRYGVALRIDENGDLVIGKAGATADEPTQPWPTLLIAINAHLEAVAVLVAAGWHLRATFPKGAQA